MIIYKFPILDALKEAGYTSYRLRAEKLFSESTITKFRNGEMVHTSNIDTLCRLLGCQPGDVIGYMADEKKS